MLILPVSRPSSTLKYRQGVHIAGRDMEEGAQGLPCQPGQTGHKP